VRPHLTAAMPLFWFRPNCRPVLHIVVCLLFAATIPGPTHAQHILGVQPGVDFEQAHAKLERRAQADSVLHNEVYYRRMYESDRGRITISAVKDDFQSVSEAVVQEISLSVSHDDHGSSTVKAVHGDFKRRWMAVFGPTTPVKIAGRSFVWEWETPDMIAEVTYFETGQPHSAIVQLSDSDVSMR